MFGMGFTEILMIAVVAILFLGPDKLPEAMVQIGKFIHNIKKTIDEAKSTFEEEVNIKELREEALSYRQSLSEANEKIEGFKHSVPNPIEEIKSGFEGVSLNENLLKDDDDDWDKLDPDWYDEDEKKTEDKKEASKNMAEVNKEEKTAQNTSPSRPKTFKNLKG